jgi:hypothetical protein
MNVFFDNVELVSLKPRLPILYSLVAMSSEERVEDSMLIPFSEEIRCGVSCKPSDVTSTNGKT